MNEAGQGQMTACIREKFSPLVSVIIPVYNVAPYLREALDSVIHQTYSNLEILVVDDGSTDGSGEICEEYRTDDRVQVIHQENHGVAYARNRGLDAAKGDYLGFIDADDIIDTKALEKEAQVLAASEYPIDILSWDWILDFNKNGRVMRQADFSSPIEATKNLMGGVMRWNLWLFLVRKELVFSNGIRFLGGANMGEDMQFMIRCFLCARNVAQIHEPLYRYNSSNESSISRQFTKERRKEISDNLSAVESALATSSSYNELVEYLDYLRLFLKLPLLISPKREDYETWYLWFPESNKAVMSNHEVPFRTRLLQWFASKRCWLAVKAYYTLVYRFVYGVIYR